MPLSFPPPGATFFNRMRESQHNEHKDAEAPSNDDGLRLYPLDAEQQGANWRGKGAVPVEPLHTQGYTRHSATPAATPMQATLPPQAKTQGISQMQKLPPIPQNPPQAQQMHPQRQQMMPPHKMAPLQHLLQPPQKPPHMGMPAQSRQMPPMPSMSPMPAMPMQMPSMAQAPKTPMIPQASPMQMMQPSQAEQTPEKAAEQFRRVNKSLPDGVRYEPLDDEIMQILREKNPKLLESVQPQPPQSFAANASPSPMPQIPPPVQQMQSSSQVGDSPQISLAESVKEYNPTAATVPVAAVKPPETRTPMIPPQPPAPPPSPMIPIPQSVQTPAPAFTTPLEPTPIVSEATKPPAQTLPKEVAKIFKLLAQDERNSNVFYSYFAENSPTETIQMTFATLSKDSQSRLEQYTTLLKRHFNQQFSPSETEIITEMEISEALHLALSEENKGLLALGNLLELTADTEAEKPLNRILNKKIIGHQMLLTAQR
ncbi:MAG: hypothetical protein FWC89_09000 [Defluviitaleaceae bacterium]|nr:hypothetical protein [Defluviitaleaceae bacterium]